VVCGDYVAACEGHPRTRKVISRGIQIASCAKRGEEQPQQYAAHGDYYSADAEPHSRCQPTAPAPSAHAHTNADALSRRVGHRRSI
jgi:hypothetical protein